MEPSKYNKNHLQTLESIGLSPEEALIYQALLEKSPLPARKISQATDIGRSMTYKMLDDLLEKNLITKIELDGKVTQFGVNHPQELKKSLSESQEAIQQASVSLDGIFGSLLSSYNLLEGKPNIQFFEGEKGMKEVLDDSLYAKEPLLGVMDIESVLEHIPKINEQYRKDREKYGVERKGIVLKTPGSVSIMKGYSSELTKVRFLDCTKEQCQHLNGVMNIYDGKVSYLTLSKDSMVGIIIEDKSIYNLHKFLFSTLWENAEEIG